MPNPVKLKAIVTDIEQIDERVYILNLSPIGRKPRFSSGQFLHLALDDFDPAGGFWPESRVFSIASASQEASIKVIYSVIGKYTQRMQQELCVAKEVWLKMPYGSFMVHNFLNEETSKVAIIAGGTGISPFLPFFAGLEQNPVSIPISLYWGVKHPEVFKIGEKFLTYGNGLDCFLFSENEGSARNLDYKSGRLDFDLIWEANKNDDGVVYFLSGPPPMIQACKNFLDGKVSKDKIIVDDWE